MMFKAPPYTPDFFILGAPKCGTTALFSYLDDHPDIFMPAVKEPTYFAHDLWDTRTHITDPDRYSALFAGRKAGQITGEASTFQLVSKVAVTEILQAKPEAKFIVCLRNPLEMLPSLHAQALKVGLETDTNLERAWQRQAYARAEGQTERIIWNFVRLGRS